MNMCLGEFHLYSKVYFKLSLKITATDFFFSVQIFYNNIALHCSLFFKRTINYPYLRKIILNVQKVQKAEAFINLL